MGGLRRFIAVTAKCANIYIPNFIERGSEHLPWFTSVNKTAHIWDLMHFVHFLVVFLYLSHMFDVSSGAETTAWLEKSYIEQQVLCCVVTTTQCCCLVSIKAGGFLSDSVSETVFIVSEAFNHLYLQSFEALIEFSSHAELQEW